MRVLWIVNLILPQLSNKIGVKNSSSGTWLFEWSKKLSNSNVDFAVACVHGNKFEKIISENITFYMLPGTGKSMLLYKKKYEKIWKKIVSDFKPDIINIHGTEYCHGLSCMRSNPNENYIVSLQGILGKIKNADLGGLTYKEILLSKTFREWIRCNGILENHLLHKKGAKYEKEMIQRSKYIACANEWDKSFAMFVNPDAKLFSIDYDMQDTFKKSKKWSTEEMKQHLIFTNPGGTPLKGVHQLLKSVSLLKKKYPDIKVNIPGMGKDNKLIINSGYTNYLSKLIKKLGIENHVNFLGYQTPQQMCQNMLDSNVVIIPSSIEGTSLILRESMYLGCPTIATFRGGMANYITSGYNGFAYDFPEYQYLATLIDTVFSMSISQINQLSKSAISRTSYYDTNNSFSSLMEMYLFVCAHTKQ